MVQGLTAPAFHTVRIVPSEPDGGWVGVFAYFFEGAEYGSAWFLAPLGEMVTAAREYLDTGTPLKRAQADFLQNVVLTGRLH